MTFKNHRHPQLRCLFLEHISSKKNVINLNCKFAFINYMVGIHTLLYYNKAKSLIQAREEQKAVDFSLVFRLKESQQKMYLSCNAKLHKACLRTCLIKFCGYKFARITKFSVPQQLSLFRYKISYAKRCHMWDSGLEKTERNHQEMPRSLYAD